MDARMKIGEALCTFFVRLETFECDIQNIAIIDHLLLQNFRCFYQGGINGGRRHRIDDEDELGETLNAGLQLCPCFWLRQFVRNFGNVSYQDYSPYRQQPPAFV